jgi:hypothetical protein
LDIFGMAANVNIPTKDLVNWEFMIFHGYKVDAKISNALWNGKRNMKPRSQLLAF